MVRYEPSIYVFAMPLLSLSKTLFELTERQAVLGIGGFFGATKNMGTKLG